MPVYSSAYSLLYYSKNKQYFPEKALQKLINCGYETTVNLNLLSLKTLIKQETLLIHVRHDLEILIINRI